MHLSSFNTDCCRVLKHGFKNFLQHLNNQQPSIHSSNETENDNKLTVLDTAVSREPDSRLTTFVYRKPMHTDQYLVFTPPTIRKMRTLKYLYKCAKHLVTKPSVTFFMYLQGENICHLFLFLMLILFLSCRKSPRPQNQTPVLNLRPSSNLLRFYPMSKVCQNNFTAAQNNKACKSYNFFLMYVLFSSQ